MYKSSPCGLDLEKTNEGDDVMAVLVLQRRQEYICIPLIHFFNEPYNSIFILYYSKTGKRQGKAFLSVWNKQSMNTWPTVLKAFPIISKKKKK